MNLQVAEGLLIPFLGTSLGAAMVFFLKKQISGVVQKSLTGFAAGVMVAASFWSLLQPALDSSAAMGSLAFLPAAVGFLVGVGFLLLLDVITPHMHMDSQSEGPKNGFRRTTKLILAVTLHNIPEGMAVGVVYAGLLSGSTGITAAGALTLSLGIAIQNLPEGAIVSMPLLAEGMPKRKTFLMGVRGGRHDVCGRGGTDPRNVRRGAFQHRYHRLFTRFRPDDDPGRRAGVTGGRPLLDE